MVEHDQLDKGTGFLRHFPLRCPLASAHAHHGTTDADAFARLEADVADQPVTLVEEAEHGDALGHRCHPGIDLVGSGTGNLWQRAIVIRHAGFRRGPVAPAQYDQQRSTGHAPGDAQGWIVSGPDRSRHQGASGDQAW